MGIEGQDVRAEVASEAENGVTTAARGEWAFEGVASSTTLDRERETVTREALEGVAREGALDLVVAHQRRPEVVGRIEQCEVDGEVLRVRGTLRPDEPAAAELRERLAAGERLGLSLGGKVRRSHWGWHRESEGAVKHLDEVAVSHVAVCEPEAAINPDVWVETVEAKDEV